MSIYARIQNGVVAELFETDGNIAEMFHADLEWDDVTNISPLPQQGWIKSGSAYVQPQPPPPTLAQQAAEAMLAGLTITLSGSITLAATLFPTDPETQIKLNGVISVINTTGGFPGGAETYPIKDASGTWHSFTLAQYKAVAAAIANYVAPLDLIIDGNPLSATELPSSSVSLTV